MISISSHRVLLKIKLINSAIVEIKISTSAQIKELKEQLSPKVKLDPSKQKLIFHGKILQDTSLVSEYKFEDNDVIHLVECSPSQQAEINRESSSSETDPMEYLNFLQMLTNSINSQNNFMTMLLGQDLLSGIMNEIQISDSFQHLLKRTNYNRNDSIEALTQNFANIYEILGNVVDIKYRNNSTINQLFKITNNTNIQYQVGQWIDVLDPFQHWSEAQIIEIDNSRAHVHFYGWSNDLNEWIRLNSTRIALFRTHTIQSPFSRFYSPFPNKRDQTNLTSRTAQFFDRMENMKDVLHFIDVLKEKLNLVLEQKNILELKEFNYIREEQDRERQKIILIMQLYPLMDRIGRLLLDYASYLMNYSFNYFENNQSLFKDNVKPIPRNNNSNRNETNEDILKKKLFQFEELTQLGAMRNPGEMAETFRLIRPTNQVVSLNNNNINLMQPGGGANFQRQFQRSNGNNNNSNNSENQRINIVNNRSRLNEPQIAENRLRISGASNQRYQIDYLNQLTIDKSNRRFKPNSIQIIRQEKINYIVYNKYPIKTFENFTQTFQENGNKNLAISSKISFEISSKSSRINSTVNQQPGRTNSMTVRREKLVIMAKPKNSNQHKMNYIVPTVSSQVLANKYKLVLGAKRK